MQKTAIIVKSFKNSLLASLSQTDSALLNQIRDSFNLDGFCNFCYLLGGSTRAAWNARHWSKKIIWKTRPGFIIIHIIRIISPGAWLLVCPTYEATREKCYKWAYSPHCLTNRVTQIQVKPKRPSWYQPGVHNGRTVHLGRCRSSKCWRRRWWNSELRRRKTGKKVEESYLG